MERVVGNDVGSDFLNGVAFVVKASRDIQKGERGDHFIRRAVRPSRLHVLWFPPEEKPFQPRAFVSQAAEGGAMARATVRTPTGKR